MSISEYYFSNVLIALNPKLHASAQFYLLENVLKHYNVITGTPLLFVVVGLAARSDYYGVRGDDGQLSL